MNSGSNVNSVQYYVMCCLILTVYLFFLWFILFVNIAMEMKVERNAGGKKIEKLKNFIMSQYYKSKGVLCKNN